MIKKILVRGAMFLVLIILGYAMVFYYFVDRQADDYFDNERASNVMISYSGSKEVLEYYVMTADYTKVKDVLKSDGKSSINKLNSELDMTPLMIAATLPNVSDARKISALLLNQGADINVLNSHGANVLYYAASQEDGKKRLEFYIENGAKINIKIRNIDQAGNLVDKTQGKMMTMKEYCADLGIELSEK